MDQETKSSPPPSSIQTTLLLTPKEYYQFVCNETEIVEYLDLINVQSGVFVVTLNARNKYNPTKDTVQFKLKHGNCRKFEIAHYLSSEKILKMIKALQIEKGLYTDDEGRELPNENMVVYITDNPRDQPGAFQSFMESMTEAMRSNDNLKAFKNNFYRNVRGFVHGSLGEKNFLALDIDDKDLETDVRNLIQENKLPCIVIETHGGFHVLVRNKILNNNQRKAIVKFCEDHDSVSKDCNRSSPVPGTFQGGFPVKLRKDLMELKNS